MNWSAIKAERSMIEAVERGCPATASLYRHEEEFYQRPQGVSVVVPVFDGAAEIAGLLYSLQAQTIGKHDFEVIFSLNGCTDNSIDLVQAFASTSEISCVVIEAESPSISEARNSAINHSRYRYVTFVDHDDSLSRSYLHELVRLADYRSIVVSNIIRVDDGCLAPDYAQEVITEGFRVSGIFRPQDIDLCFRAYTLNAIKLAPAYMVQRVQYDPCVPHCEDIKYWRDVFHAFMPITVKSPGWSDIYYRTVRPRSASRNHAGWEDWALPRQRILSQIEADLHRYSSGSPQQKYDLQLIKLLRETLASHRGDCLE